jgi:hypothetical protein
MEIAVSPLGYYSWFMGISATTVPIERIAGDVSIKEEACSEIVPY